MKSRLKVALIGVGFVAVTSSLGLARAIAADEARPEALISRARAVLTIPGPPSDAIKEALGNALDASLLILPEAAYAAEAQSLIKAVKKALAEGAWLSEKTHQDLGQAYKLVNGGKAWRVPEELGAAGREKRGIKQATEICARLLDSALAEHRAGRNEAAVRDLLAFVLLVVTPIEA